MQIWIVDSGLPQARRKEERKEGGRRWEKERGTEMRPRRWYFFLLLKVIVRKRWPEVSFINHLLVQLYLMPRQRSAHTGAKSYLCAHKTRSPSPRICFVNSAFVSWTGSGFFMHFNSSSVSVGGTAVLESRTLYPKRGFQCLQFYLYNSGSENDQLNIYTREYSADNVVGTLTPVEEIKGTMSTFLLSWFRVR